MFTTVDKALVALIMSVLFLLNYFGGLSVPFLTEGTVTAIIAGLTPILTYLVPNRE